MIFKNKFSRYYYQKSIFTHFWIQLIQFHLFCWQFQWNKLISMSWKSITKMLKSWNKISHAFMSWSKWCDEMLHINIDSRNYIRENSNEEILFFLKTKYFFLITDNATHKHWVYFLKKKSDFFDILIFFFNYLKNLNIQLFVILRSDWAEKILSIRIQKLLKNNKIK